MHVVEGRILYLSICAEVDRLKFGSVLDKKSFA